MSNLAFASTVDEATARVRKIRSSVEDVKLLIVEAYQARDWLTLGYRSWDHYCSEEFGGGIALPKSERGELVFTMRNAGMSYRAIESATDMSNDTARRIATDSYESVDRDDEPVDAELIDDPTPIRGVNGKTYRPVAPRRSQSMVLLDEQRRLAQLPPDLIERVESDSDRMTVGEAEALVIERRERIVVWADKIRSGLRTFGRMAGNPIPPELTAELTHQELTVLAAILAALTGGDYGFLG